jgi:putative aldouronate transport system substrate-binding protein
MIDTGYAPSLFAAIQQGAFTDLTPIYSGSSFATDYPNLAKISQLSWQNSRINGKYYTVPRPRPLTGEAFLYRKDWADKVGVSNPQTADDLLKMFKAFAKQNLDGGKSQTWGINFSSGVFASNYQGQGAFFFNIFGAPNQWRKNADGSLTNLIETDEFKQGLSFLNQMYKAGLIYPNAFAQTGQDMKDGFSAGKYGAYMDTITGVPSQTINLNKVYPDAKLSVLTPFGANGATPNHWLGKGFNAAAGIPSSTGNDANKLKLVLRVLDYMAAPTFSIEANFLQLGVDGWDNATTNGTTTLTPAGNNEIPGLFNQANANLVFYYPQVTSNPNLPVENQGFTANLMKIGVQDPTLGLYSPTFVKQGAVLGKLIDDRATRIVTGNAPLSSVSDLISSWKAQGGTLMAKEYAAASK